MPQAVALTFFLLCAYIVAAGGVQSARRQSHALGVWIIRGLQLIPLIGPTVSDAAIKLTKLIAHELGEMAKPAGERVSKFFAGLGQYVAAVGYWSLLWPKELFTFAYWLLHSYIPRLLKHTPAQVVKIVNGTVKVIRRVETRVVHVTRTIPATAKTTVIHVIPRSVREAGQRLDWLKRHWKAITAAVAGAGAIALPGGGAGRIEREVAGLRKRLGKLDRRTVGLGAAALVTAALARLGLTWIRCRNTTKVGKNVCNAGNLFGDLLAAEALFAVGAFSIERFAREMQYITPAVAQGISQVVSEAPDFGDDFDADWLAGAGDDLLAFLI